MNYLKASISNIPVKAKALKKESWKDELDEVTITNGTQRHFMMGSITQMDAENAFGHVFVKATSAEGQQPCRSCKNPLCKFSVGAIRCCPNVMKLQCSLCHQFGHSSTHCIYSSALPENTSGNVNPNHCVRRFTVGEVVYMMVCRDDYELPANVVNGMNLFIQSRIAAKRKSLVKNNYTEKQINDHFEKFNVNLRSIAIDSMMNSKKEEMAAAGCSESEIEEFLKVYIQEVRASVSSHVTQEMVEDNLSLLDISQQSSVRIADLPFLLDLIVEQPKGSQSSNIAVIAEEDIACETYITKFMEFYAAYTQGKSSSMRNDRIDPITLPVVTYEVVNREPRFSEVEVTFNTRAELFNFIHNDLGLIEKIRAVVRRGFKTHGPYWFCHIDTTNTFSRNNLDVFQLLLQILHNTVYSAKIFEKGIVGHMVRHVSQLMEEREIPLSEAMKQPCFKLFEVKDLSLLKSLLDLNDSDYDYQLQELNEKEEENTLFTSFNERIAHLASEVESEIKRNPYRNNLPSKSSDSDSDESVKQPLPRVKRNTGESIYSLMRKVPIAKPVKIVAKKPLTKADELEKLNHFATLLENEDD